MTLRQLKGLLKPGTKLTIIARTEESNLCEHRTVERQETKGFVCKTIHGGETYCDYPYASGLVATEKGFRLNMTDDKRVFVEYVWGWL